MAGLQGRSTNVLLLLTPRWCWGSGGVALLWLATAPSKVPRAPAIEARLAWPCSMWSSRWSRLLQVDWRTRSYLLRCMVAPVLLQRRSTTWLACRRSVDQAVLGRSAPRRSWSSSLAPLLPLHGRDDILLSDSVTHELVEGLALERHQLLTDLGA
jgi:hypothetical protein